MSVMIGRDYIDALYALFGNRKNEMNEIIIEFENDPKSVFVNGTELPCFDVPQMIAKVADVLGIDAKCDSIAHCVNLKISACRDDVVSITSEYLPRKVG